MVANWSNPTNSTTYTSVLSDLKERDLSAAKLDPSADSNIPTNAKKFNSTLQTLENWSGSAWVTIGCLVPPGAILPYAGATAPAGFLLCNDTPVSRSTYAVLFALITTTYGAGDGTSTFNVPDMRQRFPLGKAASGTGSTLGGTGGQIDHTHTVPAHYHSMGAGATLNIVSSGAHTTSVAHDHAAFNSGAGTVHKHTANHTHGVIWADPSGSHSHTVSASTFGPSGTTAGTRIANSNVTTGSSTNTSAITTGVEPAHSHFVDIPLHFVDTSNESAHTHSIDVPNFAGNSSSDGAHTHAAGNFSGAIGLVSGGSDGNSVMNSGANNPPFVSVNYIIKT